ncbi:hypothetical protein ABIB57_004818 [Devosia sp. UYZn731]|uniref:hypothetical protein n=1 Tax=Devosia sp. UYZn731 TaxID=3156345 RepID=UPI0033993610
MHKILLTAAILAVPFFAVTPSFAMKGIDAARSCEAQKPKCRVTFDDGGGATIFIGDTIIDCPTPQGECSVVRVVHGRGDFGPADTSSGGLIGGRGNPPHGGNGGNKPGNDSVGSNSGTATTDVGGSGLIQ